MWKKIWDETCQIPSPVSDIWRVPLFHVAAQSDLMAVDLPHFFSTSTTPFFPLSLAVSLLCSKNGSTVWSVNSTTLLASQTVRVSESQLNCKWSALSFAPTAASSFGQGMFSITRWPVRSQSSEPSQCSPPLSGNVGTRRTGLTES